MRFSDVSSVDLPVGSVKRSEPGEKALKVTTTLILTAVCAVLSAQTRALAEPTGTALPYHPRSEKLAQCSPAVHSASSLASDTDGDGVFDAQDVCCRTPTGVPADATGRPLGDFDLDCDVDQADFSVFQEAFTGPLEPCSLEICDNGLDDDTDGFVDCDDWDCSEDPACAGSFEICDNGIDDDEDAFVDCDDYDCIEHPACIGKSFDNDVDLSDAHRLQHAFNGE